MRIFGQAALLAATALVVPSIAWCDENASVALAVKSGAVNAAVAPTVAEDGSRIGGTSKLEVETEGLQASITGAVSTTAAHDAPGEMPAVVQAVSDRGSWTRAQIGVSANAKGPAGSTIALKGSDQITQSVSPYRPGDGGAPETLETRSLAGDVTASLPLASGLDVKLGAQTSQSSTRRAAPQGDDGTHLTTGDTQLSGSLSYRINGRVTVTAGATLEQQTAGLDGGRNGSASYSFVKPRASVAMSPRNGAKLTLGVEQTVEPLNGANYMALANISDPKDLKIAPDRAWQTQASLEQKLGAARLSASLTNGVNGSATELAPIAGGQTPASVDLKQKQKVKLGLSVPLEALGLSHTELQSQATWRHSLVRDPVTGKYRRASGEAPREASVGLAKVLPGSDTKIGVKGGLGTVRDFYQVGQSTEVRTAPSLDAFVSYAPGPVSLNLSVDGLVGGSQQFTDTFYDVTRNGPPAATDSRKGSKRHISFSLSKKF